MADLSTVLSVAGAAAGVHFVTDISQNQDPFPHLLAGGVLMGFLAFIALVDVDLALAFAVLVLVVSLVNKSDPLFKVVNGLTSQKG